EPARKQHGCDENTACWHGQLHQLIMQKYGIDLSYSAAVDPDSAIAVAEVPAHFPTMAAQEATVARCHWDSRCIGRRFHSVSGDTAARWNNCIVWCRHCP